MSVPKYKRIHDSDLLVILKSTLLMKEACRLSKCENILPKKTERLLIDDFINTARNIMKYIYAANELNLNDSTEAKLRKTLQLQAKILLSYLMSNIKLQLEYLNSDLTKYKVLITLINETKQLLNSWITSDNKRL